MPAHPDYYEVLQVSPNAEYDIIKAAYKHLAFKWHPDRRPGDPSASQQMKLLNEAYDVLSDPQKRQEYDLRRNQSGTSGAEQQEHEEKERKRHAERQHQEAERKRQEQERHKREAPMDGAERTPQQVEPAFNKTLLVIGGCAASFLVSFAAVWLMSTPIKNVLDDPPVVFAPVLPKLDGNLENVEIGGRFDAFPKNQDGGKKEVSVTVLVPQENATLIIDGVSTKQSGTTRTFVSPPLDTKGTYTYTLKAIWEPNNYTKITRTLKVKVEPRAKRALKIDMTKEDPRWKDDIATLSGNGQ